MYSKIIDTPRIQGESQNFCHCVQATNDKFVLKTLMYSPLVKVK